ncbi:MAG: DUF3617 domain-containing protein [Thermodesulforhabdaceae bacterium]
MRRMFFYLILICSFFMSHNSFCGELNFKEGLWEITTEMTASNVPYQMPPQKITQCIKDKNANYSRNIFVGSESKQDCKVEEKIEGNTVHFKIVCKEGNEIMTNEGEITYRGDSFEGSSRATSSGEDKVEVTYKVKGRWIGECQK